MVRVSKPAPSRYLQMLERELPGIRARIGCNDLPLSAEDVLVGEYSFHTNGSARVNLAGADTYLGSKSKAVSISKSS
jgi:hypothetical protein